MTPRTVLKIALLIDGKIQEFLASSISHLWVISSKQIVITSKRKEQIKSKITEIDHLEGFRQLIVPMRNILTYELFEDVSFLKCRLKGCVICATQAQKEKLT